MSNPDLGYRPFDADNQEPGTPAGPQPGIHFIKCARAGLDGQKMDQAPGEAAKKHTVVDWFRTIRRMPAAASVMNKNEIEI